MDRQIPDDIDVFLIKAQVHSGETDITEIAQTAAVNEFLHFDHRGAVDKCMAGHQSSPGKVSDFGQLSRLAAAVRKRLFDKYVLASHQSVFCQFVVGTDVGCDEYRIDI